MSINSASFQIVKVANILNVPASFPEHVCYYTQDTDKYYIYRNSLQEEVFITGGTNNFITAAIDTGHADLVVAKLAGTLITGQKYRITDFQTIYDQPDFNNDGTPKTNPDVKMCPIEPIIVTAIAPDELGVDAFQEDHPNDTIQYILEFTTPVTNTPTKGRIIKRIDENLNESDFDHRNVYFKRYLSITQGDYIDYKDNGEASQEFLAIPLTPQFGSPSAKSSGNYLGKTFNYFSSNSTPPYNGPGFIYDLPNIVIGPFAVFGDVFRDNIFNGYVMNVTLWGESMTNVIDGTCINVSIRHLRNNKIGNIINVYSNPGWQTNVIGTMINLNIIAGAGSGGDIALNTISEISNLSGRLMIQHSTIHQFSNTTIIDEGWLLMLNSNVGIFDDNVINAKLDINKLMVDGEFRGNTFNKTQYNFSNNITYPLPLTLNNNKFSEIRYNIFNDNFLRNKGMDLSYNIFKGVASSNDFGNAITGCEFGDDFGVTDIYEYDNQNELIGSANGNVFLTEGWDLIFGAKCGGNIFSTEVSNVTFGDYLTNNHFKDFPTPSNRLEFIETFKLYERFKTKIFALQMPHGFTYSVGDQYINNSSVDLYFYRSELINGVIHNFFIRSNPEPSVIWQTSLSLLGTVDGLNQSSKNTRLLNSDYSGRSTPDSIGYVTRTLSAESNEYGIRSYIPTLTELQEIYNNRTALNLTITEKVWSSTEYDANYAWVVDFTDGTTSYELKSSQFIVIPIWLKTYDYILKLQYVDEYGSTTIVDLN